MGGRYPKASRVSGELVQLEDDGSARIARYVDVLSGLPAEPPWVLVGGLAVNIRLRRVHRATNDIDTVTHNQVQLVRILVDARGDPLGAGKVKMPSDVEVDVMDSTERAPLPSGPEERTFSLVRRWTMRTATVVDLGAVAPAPAGFVTARARLHVATRGALIAMKVVSIPRRSSGHYPAKIGSDMQDLFRLVEGENLEELAQEVRTLGDQDALKWLASTLIQRFSAGTPDLRYAVARLRQYVHNIDAERIGEAELGLLGLLGEALI